MLYLFDEFPKKNNHLLGIQMWV